MTEADNTADNSPAKGSKSGMGVVGLIVGVLVAAIIAAVVLSGGSNELSALKTFDGTGYSVQHPEDWNMTTGVDQVEFFSGDTSEDSASGLVVIDSGVIPGYEQLNDSQRDEIINLALENVRDNDDTISEEFTRVDESTVELGSHPAAEKALTFTFSGELAEGGEGTLVGYMIITTTGQSYVLFTGGDSGIYNDNESVFDAMLQSFTVVETESEEPSEG